MSEIDQQVPVREGYSYVSTDGSSHDSHMHYQLQKRIMSKI